MLKTELLLPFQEYIYKTFGESWFLKIVFALFIFILSMPYFDVFVVLIMLDFITGIVKAICKKEFASQGLKKGLIKLVLYCFAIITVSVLASINMYGISLSYIVNLLIIYICITEGISIFENINELLKFQGIELKGLEAVIKVFKKTETSILEKIDEDKNKD